MVNSQKLTESTKKQVAANQMYKCANSPDNTIRGLENYNCLLWESLKYQGTFDKSGYEIDHIVEYSVSGNNDMSNLQALCNNCHSFKTRKFMSGRNVSDTCAKSKIMETLNKTHKIINNLIDDLNKTNDNIRDLEDKLVKENYKISELSFNLFDKNMLKWYNSNGETHFYQEDVDLYFEYLGKIHEKVKIELSIRQKRQVDIQLVLRDMKNMKNNLLNLVDP